MEPALAALLDKREIEDLILRYCRGIDRLDLELVRSCYHVDATDSHGSFSGGVDEFVAWVGRLLVKYESTSHFVGNVLVELAGDAAVAETYGVAFHRGREPKPELNLSVGFRYLDRFERRAGAWKIARRVCVTEWARVDDGAGRFPIGDGQLHGARDRSDPLYALLATIGH